MSDILASAIPDGIEKETHFPFFYLVNLCVSRLLSALCHRDYYLFIYLYKSLLSIYLCISIYLSSTCVSIFIFIYLYLSISIFISLPNLSYWFCFSGRTLTDADE